MKYSYSAKNELNGQENLLRAYEICLTGKFLMKLFSFGTDENHVDKTQIDRYNEMLEGTTTIITDKADILIEIVKPSINSLLSVRKQETIEDIKNRVKGYPHSKPQQNISPELCDSSQALLKTAYNRLGLMPYEVQIIIEVAQTIAMMDGENKILVQHLAEAIQYRSIDKEILNKLN